MLCTIKQKEARSEIKRCLKVADRSCGPEVIVYVSLPRSRVSETDSIERGAGMLEAKGKWVSMDELLKRSLKPLMSNAIWNLKYSWTWREIDMVKKARGEIREHMDAPMLKFHQKHITIIVEVLRRDNRMP